MTETSGKSARVIGTFILMIGSGLVLDRDEIGLGVAVMFVGWVAFVWGLLVAIHRYRSESTEPVDQKPLPSQREIP